MLRKCRTGSTVMVISSEVHVCMTVHVLELVRMEGIREPLQAGQLAITLCTRELACKGSLQYVQTKNHQL